MRRLSSILIALAISASLAHSKEAKVLVTYQCADPLPVFSLEITSDSGDVTARGRCSREDSDRENRCTYACELEFSNHSSACKARINGTFRFAAHPVKFVDWGAGIVVNPKESEKATGTVRYTVVRGRLDPLRFEFRSDLFECEDP